MIIYNHVVNQCEDQKLILSQIFNTPIYMPNYSCIGFQDLKSRGVGRVKLGSCSVKVIRGHFEFITQIFLRNYSCSIIEFQDLEVTRDRLVKSGPYRVEDLLRSFEVIWNLPLRPACEIIHTTPFRDLLEIAWGRKFELERKIDLRSFGVNDKNNLSNSISLRFSIRR